jgi:hypothetical protein
MGLAAWSEAEMPMAKAFDLRSSAKICGKKCLRLRNHRHAVHQHLHVAHNNFVAGLYAV